MDRDLGYNDSNTKEEISREYLVKLEQYQALLSSACQTSPFPIQGNSGFDPLSIGMLFPFQPSSISFLQDQDNVHYWPSGGHLQNSSVQEGFFSSLQEMSASVNGVLHGKRLGDICIDHPKISKKPRFESRPSLSTFKVRKEKLGDRIAALQQLVAPFGKTDTASVLMEATGYIKFLQDQVETLSVPYMRSSNSKEFQTTDEVSSTCDQSNPKPDLRSRGLCLVPLSCTSYFANDDNSLWPPHNFR